MQRQELRRDMRQRRLELTQDERTKAALSVCEIVKNIGLIEHHAQIGFYLAHGGEMDPAGLVSYAWKLNKTCYLPKLEGDTACPMRFAPYEPQSGLKPNRFGIAEPDCENSELITGELLDIVFIPLVAFDIKGNRIGMGQGFYDRTFAGHGEKIHRTAETRRLHPLLIGLAYRFQQVDALEAEPWDVPLDAVVTENELIDCSGLSNSPGLT